VEFAKGGDDSEFDLALLKEVEWLSHLLFFFFITLKPRVE